MIEELILSEKKITCEKCKTELIESEMVKNFYVCPRCGKYNKIPARARLELICDPGTINEKWANVKTCNPILFSNYMEKIEKAEKTSGENEAVITALAKIGGHKACVFCMEPKFMMASMGTVVGDKITALLEYASKYKLPVVGVAASGGARMQEGMLSLMQMAKVSAAAKKHSDAGLFYMNLLTDPTTGGVTASFAMLGDVLIAEPGALIGFAGKRVIENTTGTKLPENFQSAEFQLENGFLDAIVDRNHQREYIARMIELHSFSKKHMDGPVALSHIGQKNVVKTADLPAFERIKKARDTERPTASDYIKAMFPDFIELHGDRTFKDDHAVIGGLATLHGMAVTVIGIEKGHTMDEKLYRSFGCVMPEGYRKAKRLMMEAEKFHRPVICIVDTQGANPGIGAEERGAGHEIADNLYELITLKTPMLSLMIGEGGSGGALALAIADEVWMLENAYYSVVSPEACASILYKDSSKENVEKAAENLKLFANNLYELGIIERVMKEPKEFTVNSDNTAFYEMLKAQMSEKLLFLKNKPKKRLLRDRYKKYRKIGQYKEINPRG